MTTETRVSNLPQRSRRILKVCKLMGLRDTDSIIDHMNAMPTHLFYSLTIRQCAEVVAAMDLAATRAVVNEHGGYIN